MDLYDALAYAEPVADVPARVTLAPDELEALRRMVRGGGEAAAYARERLQLAAADVPETLGTPYPPLPGSLPGSTVTSEVRGNTP